MKVQQVFDWMDENPQPHASVDAEIRAFINRALDSGTSILDAITQSLRADVAPYEVEDRVRYRVAETLAHSWANLPPESPRVAYALREAANAAFGRGDAVAVGAIVAYLTTHDLERFGIPPLAVKAVRRLRHSPWIPVSLLSANAVAFIDDGETGAELMRHGFECAVRRAVGGSELLTAAGLAMLEEKGFIDFADVSAVVMRRLPWFNLED